MSALQPFFHYSSDYPIFSRSPSPDTATSAPHMADRQTYTERLLKGFSCHLSNLLPIPPSTGSSPSMPRKPPRSFLIRFTNTLTLEREGRPLRLFSMAAGKINQVFMSDFSLFVVKKSCKSVTRIPGRSVEFLTTFT